MIRLRIKWYFGLFPAYFAVGLASIPFGIIYLIFEKYKIETWIFWVIFSIPIFYVFNFVWNKFYDD